MSTPRSKFVVLPFLVAFAAALGWMNPTDVVMVNREGMGIEHDQPWRRSAAKLFDAVTSIRYRLAVMRSRTWLRVCTAGLLAMIGGLAGAPVAFGATLTEGQHTGEFLAWEAHKMYRRTVTVLSGQVLKAGAVVGRVNIGVGRGVSAAGGSNTGNGTLTGLSVGPEVERGAYTLTCTAVATNAGTFSVTTPSGRLLPSATVAVAYTSRHINFTINDGSTDFALADTFTVTTSTTAPTVSGTGNGTISAISLGPGAIPGRYRLVATATATHGGTFTGTDPDGDVFGIFVMTAGSGTATAFTSNELNFTLTDGSTDFAAGDVFEVVVFNEVNSGKVVAWDPTVYDGRHRVAGILYQAKDATAGDLSGVIISRLAVVLKGSLQWGAAITAAQKESAYAEMRARNIEPAETVV